MFNLPAVILVTLCTLLLIRGASESAKTNAVMVCIKIGVLLLFVVLGLKGWNSDNLANFAPFGLAESPPRPASSSSPTSAWTRSPRPVRK